MCESSVSKSDVTRYFYFGLLPGGGGTCQKSLLFDWSFFLSRGCWGSLWSASNEDTIMFLRYGLGTLNPRTSRMLRFREIETMLRFSFFFGIWKAVDSPQNIKT